MPVLQVFLYDPFPGELPEIENDKEVFMALGAKLKAARLEKGLTTSQVASATRMKIQIVEDIEREDFSKIAAVIYGKGFIRLYAEQVGLNPGPLIEDYLTHHVGTQKKREPNPSYYGREEDFSDEEDTEEDDDTEEDQEDEDEGQEGPDLVSKIAAFFRKTPDAEEKDQDGETKQSDAERAIQAISGAAVKQPVRNTVPSAEHKRSVGPAEKPAGKPANQPGTAAREAVVSKHGPVKQSSSSATLFDLKASTDTAGQDTDEPDFFTHIKAATDEIKTAREKEAVTPAPAAVPVHRTPAPVHRTPKQEEPVKPAAAVRRPSVDFDKLRKKLTDKLVILTKKLAILTNKRILWQKSLAGKCDSLKRISKSKAGKLKTYSRKMTSRLPDIKIFELSLNSVPVMVVILVIIILTISGLSSLVRRSGRETPPKQPVVVEAPVESFDQLRIAIEPPEPYYK